MNRLRLKLCQQFELLPRNTKPTIGRNQKIANYQNKYSVKN